MKKSALTPLTQIKAMGDTYIPNAETMGVSVPTVCVSTNYTFDEIENTC